VENNICRKKEGRIAGTWKEVSIHELMVQLTSKQARAMQKGCHAGALREH